MMKELCYFTDMSEEFPDDFLEELYDNESLMLLFKAAATANIEDMDDAVLTMVYGQMKRPPGAKDSVAQKLNALDEVVEEEVEDVDQKSHRSVRSEARSKKELMSIWVPVNPQVRATALRMFFPKVSADHTIPEPPPEPEHLAIIFPVTRKEEVLKLFSNFDSSSLKFVNAGFASD